jgi:N-acetylmuramoyl-L-alanine amidase-like protein
MAMRRITLLLVACGLGAWAAGPALSARPFVPRAIEFEQAIAPSAGDTRPGGAGAWRSSVVRAHKRFDLVGLSWRGPRDAGAQIRVRHAGGGWSPWTAMASDDAPVDAGGVGGGGAEPVWAGGADALQLRLTRAVRGLRAHFVNSTGSATAPERALTALRRTAHAAFAALTAPRARAQDAAGAPPIVAREAWGAQGCGRPRAAPSYGSVQAAFVHHTVDANDYGPQDSAAIVLAICRYHRNAKGWRDIGYNFLVDRFGQVFEGRAGGVEQAVVGAQAQGYNDVSTGVANIGTFGAVAPTPEAVHAVARLLAWKLSLHGAPVQGQVTLLSRGGPSNRHPAGTPVTFERIAGHRDADGTSCPGDALAAQLPEIRRQAAQLAPAPAPAATVTLDAADATLDYPQPAQLAGRATDAGGVPLAGAPISLQIAAGTGFETLARTATAADGSWSALLATRYTRTLRAVARLPAGGLAASRPIAIGVAPRIGARAPRRVTARRPFTLRGSVRPPGADLTLTIARQGSDGAFHTVARVALRTVAGTFRHTLRLRRAALHRLRIVSRGDARNSAGRSRDVVLRAVAPHR